MEPRLLSVPEAAEYLGVSIRHFMRYLRREIPTVNVGGTLVRYDKQTLDRWITEQQENPLRIELKGKMSPRAEEISRKLSEKVQQDPIAREIRKRLDRKGFK